MTIELMKVVWIINEVSPGHLAQSRGLVDALKSHDHSIEVAEFDIGRRFSGVQRFLIRRLMGRGGKNAPSFLRTRVLENVHLPEGRPDLILSSGGKSVFTGRLLANQFDAPYVFIGERKPYPSEWFHTVFTPSPLEQGKNDVAIDRIPTGVNPELVEEAAANYEKPKGRLWSMIVGGASRSHPYTESDWVNLASGMNELARRQGIRWLLTTSRRTGKASELLLMKNLEEEFLADAIWWADKPERRMMAFLGSSERAFVTQDSVTMVTECVASGRPTVVLQPRDETFPKNSFMPRYFENLEAKDHIVRLPIASLARCYNLTGTRATLHPIEIEMAKILLSRLSLNYA